jgi:hypothetical protein
MKLMKLNLDQLVVSEDLSRSGSAKQFEDRLKSSIEQVGLAEPLKVAPLPTGKFLVIDGTMRLKALAAIRESDPSAFRSVPAYVMDYDRRFELRYQTDIYQDLLPSQLAELVEHLHQTEHILKADIARYIGVSPATLRNYTGLWRLLQRGGLFAKIVELMDAGVIPSSNPYAWLRLTEKGLRRVLEHDFSGGEQAESWIEQCVTDARRGKTAHFPIKFVEAITDALPPEYYREGEELRSVKRNLGHRRGQSEATPSSVVAETTRPESQLDLFPLDSQPSRSEGRTTTSMWVGETHADTGGPEMISPKAMKVAPDVGDASEAIRHLSFISHSSRDPVLCIAARTLQAYLQ